MDLPQNFCLQSLKDALENCDDGEVDVDDGTKKASEGEEVSRLTKTTINVEKGHNDKEEEGKKTKGKRKKKVVKFSPTTPQTSYFRSNESQTRILNLKVRNTKFVFYKNLALLLIIFI